MKKNILFPLAAALSLSLMLSGCAGTTPTSETVSAPSETTAVPDEAPDAAIETQATESVPAERAEDEADPFVYVNEELGFQTQLPALLDGKMKVETSELEVYGETITTVTVFYTGETSDANVLSFDEMSLEAWNSMQEEGGPLGQLLGTSASGRAVVLNTIQSNPYEEGSADFEVLQQLPSQLGAVSDNFVFLEGDAAAAAPELTEAQSRMLAAAAPELTESQSRMLAAMDSLNMCMVESGKAYDPSDPEFFWEALFYTLGNYSNLRDNESAGLLERDEASGTLKVFYRLVQEYATGLFADYDDLLELPEGSRVSLDADDSYYLFPLGDRGLSYGRIAFWAENEDGTCTAVTQLLSAEDDSVIASFEYVLTDNAYADGIADPMFLYSVKSAARLD